VRTVTLWTLLALALLTGACSGNSTNATTAPAASGRRSPGATATVAAGSPSPTPTLPASPISAATIFWALDRGPEETPGQDQQRLYLFAPAGDVGVVTVVAPNGTAAGRAPVMGSGIFSATSCVVRVPQNDPALRVIGAVVMDQETLAAFLRAPTTFTAEVDQGGLGMPNPRQFPARLVDIGCRPVTP
jgi:hypothetical protein